MGASDQIGKEFARCRFALVVSARVGQRFGEGAGMRRTPKGDLSLDWLVGAAPGGRRFGVEHEFGVSRGASPVDFRTVMSAGAVRGRRLDRSDPFARRLPWGGVVTADGREAELATPPALLAPGFTDRISRWVENGHHELQLLAADAELSGYSTHVNVEVDDRHAIVLADRFAARHSAALMLLMDKRDSPGLLVRPRRSRLELGAEYVTGEQLVAASVFAAAATKDCEASRAPRLLVAPRVVPARGRFGMYVDRHAFGPDLSAYGRSARIGGRTAQDLLTWSWDRCRGHALEFAAAHEIAAVDAAVDGRSPLPSEEVGAGCGGPSVLGAGAVPYVDMTVARRSGTMTLDPILATWDHVCFALVIDGVSRVVAVRAEAAACLVTAFESGELDAWCGRVAGVDVGALARLSSADQIGSGGVFSSIASGATLMPPERDPRTGRPGGVGNAPGQRQQKNNDDDPPRRARHVRLIAGTTAALVVIAGAVALATRDDKGSSGGSSTTVAVQVPVASVAETAPVPTVASAVPITDAATSTSAAPETTTPVPICTSLDLSPAGSGAAPQPILPGAPISSDGAGYLELTMGGTIARLDTSTSVSCTDTSTLTQSAGRTWTRTKADPITVRTPQGDVIITAGSAVVIDCRPPAGCSVTVVQGAATVAGEDIIGPSARSVSPGAAQLLPFDAVFGDPWLADNGLRDVAAGFPSPADVYQAYGPATASLTGQFSGQRTVVTAECTAGPCDVGPRVGDVADRTYDFSADCTGSPCAATVGVQFAINGTTQISQVPLAFDGANYTWDVNATTYQCTFDSDGNGTYETQLGTVDLTIHYVLTPTAAELRDGQYIVTAFHAIGDGTNTVSAPDRRCTGFGPSHNVGDITASR
jgi:hypothetical protein